MPRSVSLSRLGSEFDAFLFAPIGEDKNGMPLSVLSALARLDLDPWQEAAKFARLPGEAVRQRLTSLIAALPDGALGRLDPERTACRLVALLPRRASLSTPSRETLVGGGAAHLGVVVRTVIYVIYVAFFLGGQYLLVSGRPSAQVDVRAPASSTISPQMPRAISDR